MSKDNTEEITKIIKKIMENSKIFQRINNAFPKLQFNIFRFKKNKK